MIQLNYKISINSHIMNKYILGVGVVFVIVAGLFLVRTKEPLPAPSQTNQTGTPTNTVATAPTVIYTNGGFSPAELTVKVGTAVTFINQSDAPMWVASANHPSHTLYPEFDAKASVTKGGSYSFTFDKVGTHPYHNHILLGKYGKIIVE